MGGARVHMIKNLSQLKKVMAGKPRFEITGHCLPEYVGQVRQIRQRSTAVCTASLTTKSAVPITASALR